MKRRKYADSELDQIQRLRNENKKLKHQISSLRKQLSRIDVDRFQNLKDLLDSQDREDKAEVVKQEKETLKRAWQCWTCETGTLMLLIIERADGVFYMRKCNECNKRTKLQQYHPGIKGIKPQDTVKK